jgi:serine/threonine protein kinase
MEPDRWREVKRIFDGALERQAEGRAAFVREACAGDAELLNEVASLIASYQTAGTFFEEPLMQAKPSADPMIGRKFGVYSVIREIGQGGMGSVYLAMRDDDQFRRRVALKAVRRDLLDDSTMRRFHNERQTLAVLDHPNIIGLIDGGTSEDGLPYLVMDYVEGQPIEEYCDSHKLSIPERLQLFRTVCAAVHYAHQNLVVHRDLKPSNILVTPEGVPKLLDFGIAKLLRPEYSSQAMGLTRTRLQPMTPRYASPEQILGQPITTASDIYSLGVLLYFLLTGSHPFDRNVHSVLELQKAICEEDPEKPSVAVTQAPVSSGEGSVKFQELRRDNLARRLRGDLDMIVLMAMRKEPQRRYASAAHLAEDVRRHLEGRPVAARKGTVQYRMHKFVTRHKVGVGATIVFVTSLVASTLVAYKEWFRAERMFQSQRQFANFFVNDVDNALRRGSTQARQTMLVRAVESLDQLAGEARGDASLGQDLIQAYLKMGDVQGNLFVGNLGELDKAELSYYKALRLAEALWQADPANAAKQEQLATTFVRLGDVLPNRREGLDQYHKARQIYERLAARNPKGASSSRELVGIWNKIGMKQRQMGDPYAALDSFNHGLKYAVDVKWEGGTAVCKEQIADTSAIVGETAGAEGAIREVVFSYAHSASLRRQAGAYKTLAEIQKRTGKLHDALASARRSLQMIEGLLQKDPSNTLAQYDYEHGMVLLIDLLASAGQKDEQRQQTAKVLKDLKALLDKQNITDYQSQDYVQLLLTTPFPELQDHAAALSYARKAVIMTRETEPEALDLLARAWEKNGDIVQAVETGRKAFALLPPVPPGRKPSELRTTIEKNLADFESRRH